MLLNSRQQGLTRSLKLCVEHTIQYLEETLDLYPHSLPEKRGWKPTSVLHILSTFTVTQNWPTYFSCAGLKRQGRKVNNPPWIDLYTYLLRTKLIFSQKNNQTYPMWCRTTALCQLQKKGMWRCTICCRYSIIIYLHFKHIWSQAQYFVLFCSKYFIAAYNQTIILFWSQQVFCKSVSC